MAVESIARQLAIAMLGPIFSTGPPTEGLVENVSGLRLSRYHVNAYQKSIF